MTTSLVDPPVQQRTKMYPNGPGSQCAIRAQVHSLLESQIGESRERRSETRYPYPSLMRITPVDDNSLKPCAETIVVLGKDLSEEGLNFYHQQPLTCRRAVASLQVGHGNWLSFLIDLSWCRFSELGWYDSGGRFLRTVEFQDESNVDNVK